MITAFMLAAALDHGVPLANRCPAPRPDHQHRPLHPPWDVSNFGEGSAGIIDLKEATVNRKTRLRAADHAGAAAASMTWRRGSDPIAARARAYRVWRQRRHDARHRRRLRHPRQPRRLPPTGPGQTDHTGRRHGSTSTTPSAHASSAGMAGTVTTSPPGRVREQHPSGDRAAHRRQGRHPQVWRDAWFAGFAPDHITASGSASQASRSRCRRRAPDPRNRRVLPCADLAAALERRGGTPVHDFAPPRRRPGADGHGGRGPTPRLPPRRRRRWRGPLLHHASSRSPTFDGSSGPSRHRGRSPLDSSSAALAPSTVVTAGHVAAQWPPPGISASAAASSLSSSTSRAPRTVRPLRAGRAR